MKILVVENFAGTSLGLVGQALEEANASIDLRVMHAGDPLPEEPNGYHGLVVLGGGQNAMADDDHPYLPKIAALTRAFGEKDKAVLGICLGSQLVARGHGARNVIGRPIEFGWRQVRPSDEGRDDPLTGKLGDGAPIFHWHNDTFTMPPGAVHLASSDQTINQAFRVGRAVYGVQFHFEADRGLVKTWMSEFADTVAHDVPGWRGRYPADEARFGPEADRVGLEMARAWVALV